MIVSWSPIVIPAPVPLNVRVDDARFTVPVTCTLPNVAGVLPLMTSAYVVPTLIVIAPVFAFPLGPNAAVPRNVMGTGSVAPATFSVALLTVNVHEYVLVPV